jgi:putative tryptophan/tyrosine transport system substrate-binding protein
MRRREFITLGAGAIAFLPLGALAQQSSMRTIGVLVLGNPDPAPFIMGLREGLRDLGYREGQDIQFEVHSAGGKAVELAVQASQLVERKVDVMVAFQTPAATAAKEVTTEIPIVMEVADPVETGLIASLGHPGGNLTGVSGATAELAGKTMELIGEALPSARRVAILANANDPFHVLFLKHTQAAASSLRMEIKLVMVRSADEFESDFAEIATWPPDAVLAQPSLPQQRIADLALKFRLPAAAPTSTFTKVGGLLSYSADLNALYRHCADFVDKVLKGSKPADLPVELPTKFWLAVNNKTAKRLGVTFPPTIMSRADEVIE